MNTIIRKTKQKQDETKKQNASQKQFDDDSIITHDELEQLLSGLLADACYEPYAVYGLLFLFSSIKKADRIDAEDICAWGVDFLYPKSHNAEAAAERLSANIHKAYRAADFSTDGQNEAIKLFVDAELESVSSKTVKTTAEQTKSPRSDLQRQTLEEIALQIEMAMRNEKTPEAVKACLHSIISDASTEADMFLSDMSLVRSAFPEIIEALPFDYGNGIAHSIQAILIHDTTAFKNFYEQKLDKKMSGKSKKTLDLSESSIEDLAQKLSDVMHDPNLPKAIYECLEDNLNVNHIDFYSPENILGNLKELSEVAE